MEVTGLALGVVSLAMAFKGAVDTALFIESFVDSKKTECGYLALSYHIEKTRLHLWGQICKIENGPDCVLLGRQEIVRETIIRILGEIEKLNREASGLVTTHKIEMPNMPASTGDSPGETSGAVTNALSRLRVRPARKFRWTIDGKEHFNELVSKIRKLVDDLLSFTLGGSEIQLVQKALPSRALSVIQSNELLQCLQESRTIVNDALAVSARVKLLKKELQKEPERSGTMVSGDQFLFLRGSTVLGIFRRSNVEICPVWVEWCTLSQGAGVDKYIQRIKSLGCILEHVGGSTLRLPACYGVFDDLAYMEETGSRRLGYVFGAPQVGPEQLTGQQKYERNFRDYPPRRLSDLIRDEKGIPIPLLGDRFRLAFTLATAFSHFHASGWLHKGFHSGNVVYLRQTNKPDSSHGIDVVDALITGFQYSRPQDAQSLSRGPLENPELDHYYHPNIEERGFSRRLDLYSLGVVLVEIGRWGLIVDTVSASRRSKLTSRHKWCSYITAKAASDIGWRMGEKYYKAVKTLLECQLPDDDDDAGWDEDDLFEQQYFEKVIRPLNECSA